MMNSQTKHATVAAVLSSALVLPGQSDAAMIDETFSASETDIDAAIAANGPLALDVTGLVQPASSDATVTFSVFGDFAPSGNEIEIGVEGFSFGVWLNENLIDDSISGPVGDAGNDYASLVTGTATIPLLTLNSLLLDNQLGFTFDYQTFTNSESSEGDAASVRVQYEYNVNAVPVPTTLALFSVGLAGFGLRRRKASTAAYWS